MLRVSARGRTDVFQDSRTGPISPRRARRRACRLMRSRGIPVQEIAAFLKVSRQWVHRELKAIEAEDQDPSPNGAGSSLQP